MTYANKKKNHQHIGSFAAAVPPPPSQRRSIGFNLSLGRVCLRIEDALKRSMDASCSFELQAMFLLPSDNFT